MFTDHLLLWADLTGGLPADGESYLRLRQDLRDWNLDTGPLSAVSQDVVVPLKRATSVGLTLLLSHFLGDLFAPTISGALSDSLSGNPFFHSLGITHANSPGYAFLILGVPALLAAGIIGVWGARFVQPDEAAVRAAV